jgi:hypothetical protein
VRRAAAEGGEAKAGPGEARVRKGRKKVGLRFTVHPEHEHEVAELYRDAGFDPLRIERSNDELVTFVVASRPEEEMFALITAVPSHYSALQGFVVGKAFPFEP